jgi:hypothetical protein
MLLCLLLTAGCSGGTGAIRARDSEPHSRAARPTSSSGHGHAARRLKVTADSVPGCLAASLKPGRVTSAGLAGSIEYYLPLTNVTATACSLGGFPRAIDGLRRGRWTGFRFCHDTPLDTANDENAPLHAHRFVLRAGQTGELLLNAGHDQAYTPQALYRPIRARIPGITGWLVWHTTLKPDGNLCAGPVRPSDLSNRTF